MKRKAAPKLPPVTGKAATASKQPRIFVSYCHKDGAHREKLDAHFAVLRRDGVTIWYDGDISPGNELGPEIRRALRQSEIFVALASPDYLNSSYCFEKEYGYALRRASRKNMRVVVAIVRPCRWKHTRMGHYKALPKDGKAVSLWVNRDLAYDDIVCGLAAVVAEVRTSRGSGKLSAAAKPSVKKPTSSKRSDKVAPCSLKPAVSRRRPKQDRKSHVDRSGPPTGARP